MRNALCCLLLAWLAPMPRAWGGALEIRSDPRVELFAVLHSLSIPSGGREGFAWNQTEYSRLLRRRVKPQRGHPAVALYRHAYERASRRGWGYMSVLNAVLPCLDEALEFVGGEACLKNELAKQAADFARRSGLRDLAGAGKALSAYQASLEKQRNGVDAMGIFEAFTGLKALAKQRISPSPLLLPGQVWNRLSREGPGGISDILTVISPRLDNDKAQFDFLPLAWDVWHEQSHARLDAELESHPHRQRRLEAALEPIDSSCYGSWRQCLREHVAQGVARVVGQWAYDTGKFALAPPPPKESLPHLSVVVERLQEFQSRRGRYPSIVEFYPRLLDVFDGLVASTAVAAGGSPGLVKGAAARELKKSGLAHFQAGRLGEALADLTAAAEADPRDGEARLDAGVVLMELGRSQEALKSLNEAVKLGRQGGEAAEYFLADALSSRASLMGQMGLSARARQDAEEALRIAPQDWERFDEVRAFLARLPP